MKKIVYISIFPLTSQIERSLYLKEMIAESFEVEYWDLHLMFFAGFPFEHTLTRSYVKTVRDMQTFTGMVEKQNARDTFFVFQVYFEWRTLPLYLRMSRMNCKIGYFPYVYHQLRPLLQRFSLKLAQAVSPKEIFQRGLNVVAKAIRRAGFVRPFDVMFTAGGHSAAMVPASTRVVPINYQDYERFQLTQNGSQRVVAGDYCVFLDEGAVHSQTVRMIGLEGMDPERYYGELNRLFGKIERDTGLKVVIAAHPCVNYGRDVFFGRESYEGKTCELVRDCRFVIVQSSTALSYAVLFRKPVYFVSTTEYQRKRNASFNGMMFSAETLGVGVHNIDEEIRGRFEVPTVKAERYDDYKYTWLTSKESEGRSSREIIAEAIRSF